MRILLLCGCLTTLLLSASPVSGADAPPFEVIPPERVDFDYPDPPREGAEDFFAIAEDGKARCVIVHAADAPRRTRHLARLLADYLGLVTGASFRVTADTVAPPEGMGAIHLGDTAVAAGEPLGLPDARYGDDVFPNVHGYLVKTLDASALIVRGATPKALEYGIAGFLERYAGVRQFWLGVPGSLGEAIPSRPTLRVPEVEWRDWPYFLSRGMSMHPMSAGGNPLDFFRRGSTLPPGENYYRLMPPEKHGETHPEFYPLVPAGRGVPQPASYKSRWQPCVSNPEVVQVMADAVLEYFRGEPDALGLNVSVNDGHGDCECDSCRAMDAPGADYALRVGMSDRYAEFTNRIADIVAREYPTKAIVFLAYSATRHPPETVKLHPNILPVLTVNSAFDAWDRWMRTGARRMGLYLHHNGKSHFILPKMDLRQAARRIRYIVASGRARVFYQEMHLHWPVTGAVAYITSKLIWDPRLDVDDLLDEYCAGLFGPAAAPAMRRWHEAMESGYERWLAEEGVPHRYARDAKATWGAGRQAQFRVLNEAEADAASAALAEAAATPGPDGQMAERVALVRAMFGLQEMAVRRYWAGERLAKDPVRSEAAARRVVEDARRVVALSRNMGAYIRTTLEQPPLDKYGLFRSNRPFDVSYGSLRSGEPDPRCATSINAGVRAAADYLREAWGPERATAWWRAVGKDENERLLADAFRIGEALASGLEPTNLLGDPGYEEIGAKLAPDERDLDDEVVLTRQQLRSIAGIHAWHAERTPYRAALTRRQARSGAWSLMLEHFYRARLSRGVPAEPGRRYRVGLWIQRNAAPGNYSLIVASQARGQGGNAMPATLATIAVPARPGVWHELMADVVTPPDARNLSLRLFVNGQAQDARCWVDDLFIGQYPE